MIIADALIVLLFAFVIGGLPVAVIWLGISFARRERGTA